MVSEALSLNHGKGTHPFVDLRLNGGSQTKTRTKEIDPKVSVRGGNLNLLTLEVEM